MSSEATVGALLPDEQELLSIGRKIVEWAAEGEAVEVFVGSSTGTEVVVFEGDIESLTVDSSAGVGIRVIRDQRVGAAYAGTLDPNAIAECFAEVRDNANYGTPDEYAGLAKPDGVEAAQIVLWQDELTTITTDQKVERALELEKALRAADSRIRQVPSCRYSDAMGINAVVSTTGIERAARSTIAWIMADAIASDGVDSFEGYGLSVSRRFDQLDDERAVNDAVERCTRMLGAVKPPSSNNTPVVLDKRVTSTLLSLIGGTLSGESVVKGRSLFGNSLGTSVAPEFVNLVEDPTNADAFGASSYDGEGLATRRLALIQDGQLINFLHDSYSARRFGVASTGNAQRGGFAGAPHPGARALFLTPGQFSQDDLIGLAGDGVLIQTISGLHSGVNSVSGDFSVGAEGVLIKNGQLAGPVREFTIGSSLQSLLASIRAIGNDVEYLPSAAAGVSTLIDGVTISGA